MPVNAHSKPDLKWAVAYGAVGVVLTLVALAGIAVIKALGGSHDAHTVSSTCSGAPFQVVLAMAPRVLEGNGEVVAEVVIRDAEQRDWEVAGFGDPNLKITPDDRPGLHFAHAFTDLSDLDNGTTREIQVRPVGTSTWCNITARLD